MTGTPLTTPLPVVSQPPASCEHSDFRRELLTGLTVFLAMCYIIAVNPSVLASGTGMPFAGVLTATIMTAAVMSLIMAAIGRLPLGVAPGMGLNSFFAMTMIVGQGIPWQTALGICFWAGILHLIVVASPLRASIERALPPSLRIGAVAGIGCYLAFIGLRNAGFSVVNYETMTQAKMSTWPFLLAMIGFGVMLYLQRHRNPAAVIVGMGVATLGALFLGLTKLPTGLVSAPDFTSTIFKLDLTGALLAASPLSFGSLRSRGLENETALHFPTGP